MQFLDTLLNELVATDFTVSIEVFAKSVAQGYNLFTTFVNCTPDLKNCQKCVNNAQFSIVASHDVQNFRVSHFRIIVKSKTRKKRIDSHWLKYFNKRYYPYFSGWFN